MLLAIDQWAFKVLLSMYSFLGVVDVPREPSSDWQIVEKWTEQPDQTYRLVIESTTIPEKCRENPQKYVVFPQTYMGHQEVLVDGQMVYTNAMSEFWNLGTLFDRPFVSCRSIASGGKVVFKIDSYLYLFLGIESFPFIKNYYPVFSFLYNSIYLVACAVCISLGLIGMLLMRKVGSAESPWVFLFRDIIWATLMISYIPGYFFDADIKFFHYLIGLTVSSGFFFLTIPIFIKEKITTSRFVQIFLLNLFLWTIPFGYKHILQLITIFYCAVSVVGLVVGNGILLKGIKNSRFSDVEKVIYILILVLGVQDLYIGYISREGYFHLSILIIIISIANFLKVLQRVQMQNIENIFIKEKSKNEKLLVETLSSLHEQYKEVIHDLKSPITALNFLSKAEEINKANLKLLTSRFNDVLSGIGKKDGVKASIDWYSLNHLREVLESIVSEKKFLTDDISCSVDVGSDDTEIFFDPHGLRIIISELMDNSYKEKKNGLKLILQVAHDDKSDRLVIMVSDNGPGVSEKLLANLGQKGISTSGGGLGLHSAIKKLKEMCGEISFHNGREGFLCKISLMSRVKNLN